MYDFIQLNHIFGTEKVLEKKTVELLKNSGEKNIERVRKLLREETEKEMQHFLNLPCKQTIIKPQKEEVKSPGL